MDKIDLSKFCGNDMTREYLSKPFSVGQFTYATNGHVMLRVPRRPDAAEQTIDAKWDAPFAALDKTTFSPLALDLPKARAEMECSACEGEGREHECSDCEHECPDCHGTGKEDGERRVTTTVRGHTYQLRYVRMMLSLPGVEVADATEAVKPLIFRFDGGIGAVMPTRGKMDEHMETEKAA